MIEHSVVFYRSVCDVTAMEKISALEEELGKLREMLANMASTCYSSLYAALLDSRLSDKASYQIH